MTDAEICTENPELSKVSRLEFVVTKSEHRAAKGWPLYDQSS